MTRLQRIIYQQFKNRNLTIRINNQKLNIPLRAERSQYLAISLRTLEETREQMKISTINIRIVMVKTRKMITLEEDYLKRSREP